MENKGSKAQKKPETSGEIERRKQVNGRKRDVSRPS